MIDTHRNPPLLLLTVLLVVLREHVRIKKDCGSAIERNAVLRMIASGLGTVLFEVLLK